MSRAHTLAGFSAVKDLNEEISQVEKEAEDCTKVIPVRIQLDCNDDSS